MDHISIRGCRQNNLKDLSLVLPKGKLIIITGVSGSGKSSLAFEVIFAEAQRRYLECLSLQAKKWIKQLPRPNVDWIEGLSPPLAVGQKGVNYSPRRSIAQQSDLYDFLALLFVHLGRQHDPETGEPLKKYTKQEMVEKILQTYPSDVRIQIIAPVSISKEGIVFWVHRLQGLGFIRLLIDGSELEEDQLTDHGSRLEVIVDRLAIKDGVRERLTGSLETALELGQGVIYIQEGREGARRVFSEVFFCPGSGKRFPALELQDFDSKSAQGACSACLGAGGRFEVDENLFTMLPEREVVDFAFSFLDYLPSKHKYAVILEQFLLQHSIPKDKLASQLTHHEKDLLLHGAPEELVVRFSKGGKQTIVKTFWKGLLPLLHQEIEAVSKRRKLSKTSFSRWAEGLLNWVPCSMCGKSGLKLEALSCKINGQNIAELLEMDVDALLQEVNGWRWEGSEKQLAAEIVPQVVLRLELFKKLGLGYLVLNRSLTTLSDGEMHRTLLASQIGAKLSGVIYIFDEPSAGLHRTDIAPLVRVIKELSALNNTVILVEHEEKLIQEADHIVELGPAAGDFGGRIIFEGSFAELLAKGAGETAEWLRGNFTLLTKKRKKAVHWLKLRDVNCHNLSHFQIDLPLQRLVGFCGVSGSGKSTLLLDVIAKGLKRRGGQSPLASFETGQARIDQVVVVDRGEIGRSVRSIPATYIGLMTPLRELLAQTRLAKSRGYSARRFSLNVRGGRCEACQGLGQTKLRLPFLPEVYLPCTVCHGKRFNQETLQVNFEGYSIADLLDLSVDAALSLFASIPQLAMPLKLMEELGLNYLKLGQPFNTLSGGEMQRLKLVAELAKKREEQTLYILDEPSLGLHFSDRLKLSKILQRLVDLGHSVFFIEHQLDLLRQADWLIELGPGGGSKGGKLIYQGTPEKLKGQNTPTGSIF